MLLYNIRKKAKTARGQTKKKGIKYCFISIPSLESVQLSVEIGTVDSGSISPMQSGVG